MQNYLGRKNTCICTKDVYKTPIKKDGEMVNVCDGKKKYVSIACGKLDLDCILF